MKDVTRGDRVKGAIIGALVGDALAAGPHWFHSREEIEAHYGEWIDDYVAPVPGRYHEGLEPGQNSQAGLQIAMLLESVAECGGYDHADYTRRFDEFLATYDFTSGAKRGTHRAVRQLQEARESGIDWTTFGSFTDSSNAALRQTVLGARYATNLELAKEKMIENATLTHHDPFNVGQSLAFGLNVSGMVMGIPIGKVSDLLMTLRKESERMILPTERVPTVLASEYCPEWEKNDGVSYRVPITWLGKKWGEGPSAKTPWHEACDAVYQFRYAYDAVNHPGIQIEPAWAAVYMFGLPCQMSMVLPAAYYFAARFEDDFEMAVLTAVNSPGQNMARATFTGGLSGALVGLSGIPQRFIDGLEDHERLMELASQVAEAVGSES